jgi:hypothetical protein
LVAAGASNFCSSAVFFAYTGGSLVVLWTLIFNLATVFLLICLGFLAMMAQGVFEYWGPGRFSAVLEE